MRTARPFPIFEGGTKNLSIRGHIYHHKSSTLTPVCFAIRASIFGPISTRS
jgi:hypothetical protein